MPSKGSDDILVKILGQQQSERSLAHASWIKEHNTLTRVEKKYLIETKRKKRTTPLLGRDENDQLAETEEGARKEKLEGKDVTKESLRPTLMTSIKACLTLCPGVRTPHPS